MKAFRLTYTAEAKQCIRHLHPAIKQEIRAVVEELRENPFLGKRLQRELNGIFSLRVRNYRILYSLHETKRTILILTLGIRRTIYEDYAEEKKIQRK